MVRPRLDHHGPSARERLVLAFWDLLADRPYVRITATDLAKKAGVNKNTFYYHFDGIDSMAEKVIVEEFQPEALKALLRKIAGGETAATAPQLETSFDRLCAACSSHSTPAVRMILKNALRSIWAEMLGLDLQQLPVRRRLSFEFAVGGVIGLLEYRSTEATHLTFADMLSAEPQGFLEELRQARHWRSVSSGE